MVSLEDLVRVLDVFYEETSLFVGEASIVRGAGLLHLRRVAGILVRSRCSGRIFWFVWLQAVTTRVTKGGGVSYLGTYLVNVFKSGR